MIKYPCKECQERQLGCHSKCEKYLSVLKANREAAKQNIDEIIANDVYYKAIGKAMRRKMMKGKR